MSAAGVLKRLLSASSGVQRENPGRIAAKLGAHAAGCFFNGKHETEEGGPEKKCTAPFGVVFVDYQAGCGRAADLESRPALKAQGQIPEFIEAAVVGERDWDGRGHAVVHLDFARERLVILRASGSGDAVANMPVYGALKWMTSEIIPPSLT